LHGMQEVVGSNPIGSIEILMKIEGSQDTESAAANSAGIKWVVLIYFCSGVCSLIDEVVWVRLLKLTLGNTVYASSIVVSVFMGGLALGALVMGRCADRVQKRLRLYALLELIATVSALSLPWILQLADEIYRWFFAEYQPSPTGLLLVQVLISAAVLLVPTMVMGSTLPLLGRYVTALQSKVGSLVGKLYALNMLGAALGCFLAGFVLIRIAGVMGTLYIAAAINMTVSFGGWMLSRFYDVSSEPAVEAPAAQKQAIAAGQVTKGRIYVLMLAFFLSGLISIGYELIWMRSIVFLLGSFTYVFSAVLTVYLVGNVVGAWIGTRLAKRLEHPAMGFGVSLTCLGMFGIFYINWLVWHLKTVPFVAPAAFFNVSAMRAMFWPMLQSFMLFFLPAVAMGIGFPLALQAWSNHQHKVGQTTGTVYGVNTIGAVLGGIVTGFLLIPLLGTQFSIIVLGLMGVWLGVIMVQMFKPRVTVGYRIICLSVAFGLTFAAVNIPLDLFERQVVRIKDTKLLAVKEGVTTTASVHEESGGGLILATSGVPVAGDADYLRAVQKVLGHLGILVNKDVERALSVGFGSGETTACMSLHNLERIDGVEISPELVELSLRFFRHINLGGQLDEEVNVVYMDAKNYLHLNPQHYDLIVNDCIDPKKVAENASLYTKEYFQSALDHLNPGGTFGTYLPFVSIPTSCTNSILGTFAEVFPYVTIWFPLTSPSGHIYLYLAGSGEPQLFSPAHIDNELKQGSVGASVSHINFLDSQYVLSCYVADQDDLKRYLNGFNLNSDFRPYIEFNTDITESTGEKARWFEQFIAKVRHDSIDKHISWAEMSQNEQNRWKEEHKPFYSVSSYLLKFSMETDVFKQFQHILNGLRIMPEHATFLEQQDYCLFTLKGMLDEGSVDADVLKKIIRTLEQEQFGSGIVWLMKSWILQKEGKRQQALNAAEKAAKYAPDAAAAQYNIGRLLLGRGQLDRAVSYLEEVVRLRPNMPALRYDLAAAFALQGRFDKSISQFRQVLQIQPRDTSARCYLADVLLKQGKLNEAAEEYREVLRIDPAHLRALSGLNAATAQ
jgi:spermidine synthase